MEGKNIYIETYGCTSNKADSQVMMGLLKRSGYRIVDDENVADYLIVNSCAVKSATEQKILYRLNKLSALGKKVIVAGCLTKVNPEKIKKALPNFSAMMGPRSISKLPDVMKEIESNNTNIVMVSDGDADKPKLPRYTLNKVIDLVKISEGCLSRCSFCATKLARGNLLSYRPDSIRDFVKTSLNGGYKEIHLTSEDSSAYGRDIGTNIIDLLGSITAINGNFFIRVGMMNPLHFKTVEIEDLIKVYKNEKIFKFLHLCAQSGSNRVLADMRRGYKMEDFMQYVTRFREEIPDITVETDIIVGYPTESDEDFQLTVDMIKKTRPDSVNISKFGPRPGTDAAWEKQLSPENVSERSRILYNLTKEIELENNRKKWLHWEGEALVDEEGTKKNTFICRNRAYKPIVVESEVDLLGKTIDVRVIDAKSNYLVGECI